MCTTYYDITKAGYEGWELPFVGIAAAITSMLLYELCIIYSRDKTKVKWGQSGAARVKCELNGVRVELRRLPR